MTVEVIPASLEQQPILANLLELYIHDFSEFIDPAPQLNPDGRFVYKQLSLYWQESHRRPFLIFTDGQLAGFALIKRGSEITANQDVWDMAEFFILRSHRRRGIGSEVAHQIWRRFPGSWEVRVMQSNIPALHFWQRAVDRFTGQPTPSRLVPRGNSHSHLLTFESKA